MDFNKYEDINQVKNYDCFIDRDGNFYKVCPKRKTNMFEDSHNLWAESYIKEKLRVKNLKISQTVSMLFALASLNGPAEVLVNCYGYIYYSHDPLLYKPIVKLPNPRVANYKATEEQLYSLYKLMRQNKENTNISIFDSSNEEYTYCGLDEDNGYQKKKQLLRFFRNVSFLII